MPLGSISGRLPTNGNWSEITLDDHRGHEVINVRAARDLNEEVLHDEIVHVGNDKRVDVVRDKMVHVGNDAQVNVDNNAHTEIGNNRATHIGGNDSHQVDGDRSCRVDGDVSEDVGGDAQVNVTGNVVATFENDVTERVFGNRTMVAGARDSNVSFKVQVEGNTQIFSKDQTEIISEKGITLSCGDSSLRLTNEGIVLSSSKIVLRGGDVSLVGKDLSAAFVQANLSSNEVTVTSEGATLKLDGEATLQGSAVHLNRGAGAKPSKDEDQQGPQGEMGPGFHIPKVLPSEADVTPHEGVDEGALRVNRAPKRRER